MDNNSAGVWIKMAPQAAGALHDHTFIFADAPGQPKEGTYAGGIIAVLQCGC